MKKIKFWIRRNFGFSQRHTNGFLLLLSIVVLAISAPFIFYKNPSQYNPAQDQAELDSLVAQLERQPEAEKYAKYSKYPKVEAPTAKSVKVKLYPFNPNTFTSDEWLTLGVSRFTANNIIKYRDKAGGFKYKEQLQRIYGMSPETYQSLEPYIQLPNTVERNQRDPEKQYTTKKYPEFPRSGGGTRPKYRLAAFDINTADTTELKKIRGIGTKLSDRIVKFRDKLGGFTQPAQLADVYGLSPEVLDSLQKYTFIQPDFNPKQLNLNTATYEELRQHPYMNYNLARLIIAYRTQHGPYQTVDALRSIKQLKEEQFQKLKPYLQL